MKTKALVFIILSASIFSGNKLHAQILRAGLNFANITITNDGDIDRNKVLSSFQVGILGEKRIVPAIFFQTGIVFTGKGSKTEQGDPNGNTWYRATTNPFYLELPFNIVLKTPTPLIKFFVGAGPYVAIGISGKNKVDGKFLGTSFHSEKNIKWSNDDPTTLDYEEGAGYGIMKRFDYGFNGMAGIQLTKLVLSVHYGHGLAKLQSGSNSAADDENKHRVFSITAGIKL